MNSPDTLNPAASNPAGGNPDEFNESSPVQPGTEVEPNPPPETPAAPTPTPAVPDAPTDRGAYAKQSENQEQDDEDAQAQTVADHAIRGRNYDQTAMEDSEHGGRTNPAQILPDDGQDVVDHMQQMERSGRIDMGAYRGERNDDDETEMLGEGGMEPGDLDDHGTARHKAAG